MAKEALSLPMWRRMTSDGLGANIPSIISDFQVDHGGTGVDPTAAAPLPDEAAPPLWRLAPSPPKLLRAAHRANARRPPASAAETDEWLRVGNCLATHAFPDGPTHDVCLIARGGRRHNALVVTPVSLSKKGHVSALGSEGEAFWKLNSKDAILQLAAHPFGSSFICGVREPTVCSVFRFDRTAENKLRPLGAYKTSSDDRFTDVDLSWDSQQVLISTETGNITLERLETKKTTRLKLETTAKEWVGCKFGSHPRCFLSASGQNYALYDARSSFGGRLKLFSLQSHATLKNEKFCCFLKHPTNTALSFVSTSASVFLIDERRGMAPVFTWSHLLNASPKIMHCTRTSTAQQLLVSLSSAMEHSVKHVGQAENDFANVASSPSAVKMLRPCDFADSLLFRGHYDQVDVSRRLSSPVVGLSTLRQDRSILLMQLTAKGDLFSQRMEPDDRRSVSSRCEKLDASTLKQWKKQFQSKDLLDHYRTDKAYDGDVVSCQNLLSALKSERTTALTCNLCGRGNDACAPALSTCEACGIDTTSSSNLLECFANKRVVTDASLGTKPANYFNLSEKDWNAYTDDASRSIMDIWKGGTYNTSVTTKRPPTTTTTENAVPKNNEPSTAISQESFSLANLCKAFSQQEEVAPLKVTEVDPTEHTLFDNFAFDEIDFLSPMESLAMPASQPAPEGTSVQRNKRPLWADSGF